MAISLGTLSQAGEKNGFPVVRGKLISMVVESPIAIDPTGEVTRKGDPIYAVRLKSPSGVNFDAGTAYANTIKTGDNKGKLVWTIRIGRQPGIPQALDLVAWPLDEAGEWEISGGRDAAPRPSSRRAAEDDDGDEIPF